MQVKSHEELINDLRRAMLIAAPILSPVPVQVANMQEARAKKINTCTNTEYLKKVRNRRRRKLARISQRINRKK